MPTYTKSYASFADRRTRQAGETLEQWENRLQTEYAEKQAPAPRHVSQMTDAERNAAWQELTTPRPQTPVVPFEGRRVSELSPEERVRAAAALGIGHLMNRSI